MTVVAEDKSKRWILRTCVFAAAVSLIANAYQLGLATWWMGSSQAMLDYMRQDMERLRSDVRLLNFKIEELETKYLVLDDRTQRKDAP